jgi:hypothetical protein
MVMVIRTRPGCTGAPLRAKIGSVPTEEPAGSEHEVRPDQLS